MEGYGAGEAYALRGGANGAGRGIRGGALGWGCGARRREARRAICGARSACAGRGSGEEARTMNIARMFVTLDVSRRSGWLKPSLCAAARVASRSNHNGACALREVGGRREGGRARGEGNAKQ